MSHSNIVSALTIDLEDYFMVSGFENHVPKSDWGLYESRLPQNVNKILKILEAMGVKATFFALGWVADRFPHLLKTISQNGHELACHGFFHKLVYDQTPQEFEEDIRLAKRAIEKACGQPVIGYRAPSFSITNKTPWAWSILERQGFRYDASILPAAHSRGGMKGETRFPHHRRNLVEFPMSTLRIGRFTMPFSGGGYFRLFPYPLIRYGMKKALKECGSAIVYIHPWEFDPEQPRLHGRWLDEVKHYVNIDKMENKFKKLLRDFKFDTVQNVLQRAGFEKIRTESLLL